VWECGFIVIVKSLKSNNEHRTLNSRHLHCSNECDGRKGVSVAKLGRLYLFARLDLDNLQGILNSN
jgi:hypothetical protein